MKEGANLVVADINSEAVERAKTLGATIVSPDEIYSVSCDIFSPCALGGVLNSQTIPKIRAKVVAGGANNQLLSPSDGDALHQRGILYAPDFVASAGGCIALHYEVYGDYRQELLPDLAHRVGGIMDRVICRSRSQQIPTYLAAESIAEERMKSVRQLKTRSTVETVRTARNSRQCAADDNS